MPDPKSPRKMKLNIWDFAGQEEYYLTHRFFLTSNSLILYVWDMALDNQDHEYWLQLIQSLAPEAAVIVVGSKLGILLTYFDKKTSKRRTSLLN
jgi:internalin A